MGGRGASSSNSSNNYKWLQTNHKAMVRQIDNTIELDALDRALFKFYPNDTIKKRFTADTIRDTTVVISNNNGKISYDIFKKKSEYSKKYETIAQNLNEKEAKDRLAKLLKNWVEKAEKDKK